MTGASKILTVSYGTFSCTLEGFDDPFNTMKAIAEYFRDLAAEDRYFGAEPPQPDAAMLHKIAEREIQRRVEAKIQDNGVILRAEENEALAAPQGHRPQPNVEMPARAPAPLARPAPTLAQREAEDGPDGGAETVAEKLSRLRKANAVPQNPVTIAAPVMAQDAIAAEEDAQPLASAASAPIAVQDAVTPGDAPEPETEAALSTTMDMADLPSDDLWAAEVLTDGLQAETLIPQTIAVEDPHFEQSLESTEDSELADLLALDAATDADLSVADPAPADQAEDQAAAGGDTDLGAEADLAEDATVRAPEPEAVLAEEIATESAHEDVWLADSAEDSIEASVENSASPAPEDEAQVKADDALLASLGALIEPEDDAAEETAPTAETPALPSAQKAAAPPADLAEEEIEAILARHTTAAAPIEEALPETTQPVADAADPTPAKAASAMRQADLEDQSASEPVAPVRPVRPVRPSRPSAVDRPAVPADPDADMAADPLAPSGSRDPITVEKLQRARARVIKIRRNEPVSVATRAASPVSASLSEEAEAALAAELAAVARDNQAAEDAAKAASERRLARPDEDLAVNRLMAEARSQMEVPDTKRRQSAIAHLKAAVAATIAERRATGSTLAGNGSEKLGAYRNDLAQVVRPTSEAAPASAPRPSPLVLVSEQRIDRPSERVMTPAPAASTQPVMPTRPLPAAPAVSQSIVSGLDESFEVEDETRNIFEAESSFPEFAERLGAADLPSLLEAAAAYIACVEGRDSFTRPQLMRHISAVSEGLTREDGLRSFGTLLRDGVIERSRRGQFAINEASPILAEARKLAG